MLVVTTLQTQTVTAEVGSDSHLPFRGYLQGYVDPSHDVFWNQEYWTQRLQELRTEGFNAIVWYGPNELTNGRQLLVRHERFPEARDLSKSESERLIAQMQWLFREANNLGIQNFLLVQHIFYTKSFAEAHNLLDSRPLSKSVSHWQRDGYPEFWPRKGQGGSVLRHCGIRNELTIEYTRAVYEEVIELYPELDGFWGYQGEPLPGERSSFFKQAILPALKASKRQPIFVASQWQIPLSSFQQNINGSYENLWLDFHGYNSEQITDAKPYPGVIKWAEATGLPTIPDVYPANQLYFPFNSPRFAYDIAQEIRKSGLHGFLYYERHISGSILGPLFRKALAHYGQTPGEYSPEPWLEQLESRFGNREAAEAFLSSYDICSRVIPETCALVYSGGDVMRRELRIPYEFFEDDFPWSYMTSPARGGELVPVRHYARLIADNREWFSDQDGSELLSAPYYQHPLWGSEGGSVYNVTPSAHMRKVLKMGEDCFESADQGWKASTRNRDEAREVRDTMEGVKLLAHYYERKLAATVMALVFANTEEKADRDAALVLADEALEAYVIAAEYMHRVLDPYYKRISGAPLTEAGVGLPALIELEKKDRMRIAEIFRWPGATKRPAAPATVTSSSSSGGR